MKPDVIGLSTGDTDRLVLAESRVMSRARRARGKAGEPREPGLLYIRSLPVCVELLVVQLLFSHSRCKASLLTSHDHTIATVVSVQLKH